METPALYVVHPAVTFPVPQSLQREHQQTSMNYGTENTNARCLESIALSGTLKLTIGGSQISWRKVGKPFPSQRRVRATLRLT